MKDNQKPKLFFLLTPVDSLNGKEGQGKAEGGDEVYGLLFFGALAKLGSTEDAMAGHEDEMEEKKQSKE